MSDKEPNYTPDRTAVRAAYVRDELARDKARHAHGGPPPLTTEQYAWEFERWINGQLAIAWDAGKAAEKRDWEFCYDLVTPDEDRQSWTNPYE